MDSSLIFFVVILRLFEKGRTSTMYGCGANNNVLRCTAPSMGIGRALRHQAALCQTRLGREDRRGFIPR